LWVAAAPLRPLAELLGVTVVREARSSVPPGSAVYLTADDYMPTVQEAQGAPYDPAAWLSMLLCEYTRDEHLRSLAAVNHIAQNKDLSEQLEREMLSGGTHPLVSKAISDALAGRTTVADGQPRVLLARHLVVRAIRLVSHLSPASETQLQEAEARTGQKARGIDPLLCAIMLTHAIAVGMGAHRSPSTGQPALGSLPEGLALELICSGSFTRRGNPGNLLGRTLLLYRDYGARIDKPLRASPLELAEEALGMPLLQALAIGFHYYGSALIQTELRADLAIPRPAYVDEVSPGATDTFLEHFSGTADDLAAAAAANRKDWQNLYLQERPLLRVGDKAMVLDEAFLLDRLTTGLFFLVLEHERAVGGEARQESWRGAYAQMYEMLVEDYLKGFAPRSLGGVPTTFDEHDLQRVYDRKGTKGGGRVDFRIDFGDSVVLAEAMSGQLSVGTREKGDRAQLTKDLDRIVVKKGRQLVGSFEKVTRTPQPTGALVSSPATAVHTMVVPGGQFPGVPALLKVLDELLSADPEIEGMIDDPRCRGLHILDVRDLEHAEAVRSRDHRTLPQLLADWKANETWARSSLSDWLLATDPEPDLQLERPALLEGPLREVFDSFEEVLVPEDERTGFPWQAPT
jgi:hypothetical protein